MQYVNKIEDNITINYKVKNICNKVLKANLNKL